MIRNQLLFATLLIVTPQCATAGDLSYSFLEIGATHSAPDALDSANGLGIRGSVAISNNFHLFGGYERTEHSLADISRARFGIGYRLAVSDNADLIARISFERGEFDWLANGDGYGAEVGLRSTVGDRLELGASLRYTNLDVASNVVCGASYPTPPACQFPFDEKGGNTSFNLRALYKFSHQWGLSTEAGFFGNDNRFFIGTRLSF